jgi:hypothetical protein
MAADPGIRELMRLIVNSESRPVSALMPEPPDESGSLSGAVHAAVARMNGHYSVRDVIAEMERAGYKFQAKNPRSAVTTVLNKLVQRKRIALVSEGKGGQPSVYSNKT